MISPHLCHHGQYFFGSVGVRKNELLFSVRHRYSSDAMDCDEPVSEMQACFQFR